jgi:hypothetical protein
LHHTEFLSEDDKYFYGKTLRSQLSTYEQALLFINSISSLGMKWEYKFLSSPDQQNRRGLIMTYNIIKNLPGNHFFGISYRDYYPNLEFDSNEDL